MGPGGGLDGDDVGSNDSDGFQNPPLPTNCATSQFPTNGPLPGGSSGKQGGTTGGGHGGGDGERQPGTNSCGTNSSAETAGAANGRDDMASEKQAGPTSGAAIWRSLWVVMTSFVLVALLGLLKTTSGISL